jgi:hypothetical protein
MSIQSRELWISISGSNPWGGSQTSQQFTGLFAPRRCSLLHHRPEAIFVYWPI